MNLFKNLICSGIILATAVSSYYPVNVHGVNVEKFTITPDRDGVIYVIPAEGTGKVECIDPAKETERPIYTMAPKTESTGQASAGNIYYSESE